MEALADLHLLATNAADVADIGVDMRLHRSRRIALRCVIARRLPMRTNRDRIGRRRPNLAPVFLPDRSVKRPRTRHLIDEPSVIALQRPEVPKEPRPRRRVLLELSHIHEIQEAMLHSGRRVQPCVYPYFVYVNRGLGLINLHWRFAVRDVRVPHERGQSLVQSGDRFRA